MFKEPKKTSSNRVAGKADRLTASSRTTIRRERTVRDFENLHRLASERLENQAADGSLADLLPRGSSRFQTRVRRRQDTGAERSLEEARARDRDRRRWPNVIMPVQRGEEEGIESHRRRQAGEELLRDALQYQRPGQRMRVPRSPRTSALRFEVAHASPSSSSRFSSSPELSVEEQVLLARPYMPSPPYSFVDNSAPNPHLRAMDAHLNTVPAEPTPGFAPARGAHRDDHEHASFNRRSAPQHHRLPGESSLTATYSPPRRIRHPSPQPESHLSRSGGLGDRRRSVSSSSSGSGQDSWETLLTTMEPDIHLPSTDSSFTSATASQSTRQSHNSSQTQNTSFISTATTTERQLSRSASPASPNLPATGVSEMDMEIRNPQYDGLSATSRASMRTMLDLIQSSRQFRAGSQSAGGVEDRQRCHENLLLFYHFSTLRVMDTLRAVSEAHARLVPGSEQSSTYPQSQHPTDGRQQRSSLDLDRTVERQVQQLTQDSEDAQNSRPDTPSTQEGGSAQAAQYLGRLGVSGRPAREMAQRRIRDIADLETEVESMERFIERLGRRQNIPDGWWAAAGLGRTVRENQ